MYFIKICAIAIFLAMPYSFQDSSFEEESLEISSTEGSTLPEGSEGSYRKELIAGLLEDAQSGRNWANGLYRKALEDLEDYYSRKNGYDNDINDYNIDNSNNDDSGNRYDESLNRNPNWKLERQNAIDLD
uniref:Secreted protein n=1 Tax=Strongyloides papillosus TaxID=174720 RepID=A0A0N5BEG3_STREA